MHKGPRKVIQAKGTGKSHIKEELETSVLFFGLTQINFFEGNESYDTLTNTTCMHRSASFISNVVTTNDTRLYLVNIVTHFYGMNLQSYMTEFRCKF